jgi:hypothetical protein
MRNPQKDRDRSNRDFELLSQGTFGVRGGKVPFIGGCGETEQHLFKNVGGNLRDVTGNVMGY